MSNTFIKLILAIFLTQAALNITAYAQSEETSWTLSKKTETIAVYQKPVPGLDIDAFKGVCEQQVRLEVVGAVLENIPGYVKWIYSLSESRVIEKKMKIICFCTICMTSYGRFQTGISRVKLLLNGIIKPENL